MAEHAVLVRLPGAGAVASLDALEDALITAIDTAGVGEYDGNAAGPDEVILYMYGPDADELFDAIEEVLGTSDLPTGAYAVKRYGPPGSAEVRVDLR